MVRVAVSLAGRAVLTLLLIARMNAANANAGALDTWWTHALIDKESIDNIKQICDLAQIGPLRKRSAACDQAISNVQNTAFSDVNIYDIYIDECHAQRQLAAAQRYAAVGTLAHSLWSSLGASRKRNVTNNPNPCLQVYIAPYLNRADVQHAIHARPTNWQMCSSVVQYSYQSVLTSVIPVYQRLMARGAHMLVYR